MTGVENKNGSAKNEVSKKSDFEKNKTGPEEDEKSNIEGMVTNDNAESDKDITRYQNRVGLSDSSDYTVYFDDEKNIFNTNRPRRIKSVLLLLAVERNMKNLVETLLCGGISVDLDIRGGDNGTSSALGTAVVHGYKKLLLF